MTQIEIRANLLENKEKHLAFLKTHRELCKKAIAIIATEPDKTKRKALIDFLFANEVDEVIEFHVRKEYL